MPSALFGLAAAIHGIAVFTVIVLFVLRIVILLVLRLLVAAILRVLLIAVLIITVIVVHILSPHCNQYGSLPRFLFKFEIIFRKTIGKRKNLWYNSLKCTKSCVERVT